MDDSPRRYEQETVPPQTASAGLPRTSSDKPVRAVTGTSPCRPAAHPDLCFGPGSGCCYHKCISRIDRSAAEGQTRGTCTCGDRPSRANKRLPHPGNVHLSRNHHRGGAAPEGLDTRRRRQRGREIVLRNGISGFEWRGCADEQTHSPAMVGRRIGAEDNCHGLSAGVQELRCVLPRIQEARNPEGGASGDEQGRRCHSADARYRQPAGAASTSITLRRASASR